MSIRTRFNERVNQMSFGEVGAYGGGLFGGEILGLVLADTVVLQSINDTSAYQPLENRILSLSHENKLISGVTEHDLLHGFSGKVAAEAYLEHRIDANTARINALHGQQPEQINDLAGMGIFAGIGLTGAVAGVAIAFGARKAVAAARSRFSKPEEA